MKLFLATLIVAIASAFSPLAYAGAHKGKAKVAKTSVKAVGGAHKSHKGK